MISGIPVLAVPELHAHLISGYPDPVICNVCIYSVLASGHVWTKVMGASCHSDPMSERNPTRSETTRNGGSDSGCCLTAFGACGDHDMTSSN